jgi:hypothetical protein
MGSAVGGLPGAVVGHMAGDMIQQQIPTGRGFYHKNHPKSQDPAYKKKVQDAMSNLRSKRKTQYAKGSDEAKAHMAKLRAMRSGHKPKQEPEAKGAKKSRSKAALAAMMMPEPDMSKVTVRKKPKAKFEDIEPGEIVDGAGILGSMSKSRPGRLNYETHQGDKYYHQGHHLIAGNPYGSY